jgi:hypothetical protein
MKGWDLTAGAAKLELAVQSLQATTDLLEESWNDEAFQRFRDTHLTPMEPKVKLVLDAVRRLSELLANAQRDCE